jgi:hypothetical protein
MTTTVCPRRDGGLTVIQHDQPELKREGWLGDEDMSLPPKKSASVSKITKGTGLTELDVESKSSAR